jgi:hypothetical protein
MMVFGSFARQEQKILVTASATAETGSEMTKQLETLKELSERVGLPVGRLRNLVRRNAIEYVPVGARPMFPQGAFDRFLERSIVRPCPEKMAGRDSNGSKSGVDSFSSGHENGAVNHGKSE